MVVEDPRRKASGGVGNRVVLTSDRALVALRRRVVSFSGIARGPARELPAATHPGRIGAHVRSLFVM